MTRPLDPETLVYGFTLAGDPQVSPDGTTILYSLTTADRQFRKASTQLWLCGVDGANPRQITWGGTRNGGARWSPDGRQIAFVSDRAKQSGLFVMPMGEAGEAREVTRHGQQMSDLAWSPDGKRIAYVVPVDPENPIEADSPAGTAPRVRVTRRLDYKQDCLGYLGDLRRQLFIVDVASGERRQSTSEPADHDFPQWSPDGRVLAVQIPRLNGMCSQLGLIDAESGEITLVGPETGVAAAWAWSPNGDHILFAGDTSQTWQTDLFIYEVASAQIRRLTEDLQCLPDSGFARVAPPTRPFWLDDRRVLFHAFRGGASGLYVVDTDAGRVEPIHTWQAQNAGLSMDAARRYAVQGHASLEAMGEISVYDRETGSARLITQYSAAVLNEAPPAAWERFDVQRGEFTIEAWLLKPPDFDPARRYPLVLDVHGGPQSHYGYGLSAVQQCLATNGFLVLFCNPRGSGSYGREFAQQVIQDWGGEDYLDLMAVVDAAQSRPYVDAHRTGIFGYSYGGYMSAWVIGQTRRFKAAVCGAPVFDLESFFGTSDIGHVFGELEFGGQPHERREWYEAHSPSTFAHRASTPTLIVHGEADDRCPIGQGEQMFVALKKAGCEVEFVRYPEGAHLMLRIGHLEHRADFLRRVLAWFKSRLGDPA